MSKIFTQNLVRFTLLNLVQVFLLRNVGYYNLSTPFLYILFILLLPIRISNWLLFVFSFILGLTIDLFYDTLGLHTVACIILAFVRIIFITLTLQRDKYEGDQTPSLRNMGFRWFFFYTVILTSFHHTGLFLFETFRFADLLYTLLRVVFSLSFTTILILIYEYLFFHKMR